MSKKSQKYRLQQPKPQAKGPVKQDKTKAKTQRFVNEIETEAGTPPWLKWALVVGVAVITFWCYRYTLQNQFTNWDDGLYVETNPYIKNLTKENMKMILFHNITNNYYHPITMLTIAWNYHVGKMAPFIYYLTNVSVHVLNTVVMFFLVLLLLEAMMARGYEKIEGKYWLAAAGALFYGVHPMHVESVSWLAERKDVMYALFYFLGLIAYIKYANDKTFKWAVLVILCYGCSMLSKPLAVVFPFSLIAFDMLLKRDKENPGLKRDIIAFIILLATSFVVMMLVVKLNMIRVLSVDVVVLGALLAAWIFTVRYYRSKNISTALLEKFPFFLLSLAGGIWAWQAQKASGAVATFGSISILRRAIYASYGLTMYVVKAFIPSHLCSYYPYLLRDPAKTPIPYIYYTLPFVAFAIITVPVGLVWFFAKKYLRVVLFGMGFFFFNVMFVLQFVSSGPAIMADRYTYVAYFGIFFTVVYLAGVAIAKKPSAKMPVTGILAVYLAVFSYLCYERTYAWHDTRTLWEDVIEKYPGRVQTSYKNLGNYYADLGPKDPRNFDSAYTNYLIMVKDTLADAGTFSNLANIYGIRKQWDKSLEAYGQALKLDSTSIDAHLDRAITLSMMKRYDEAMKDYSFAYRTDPKSEKVLENMASTYENMGIHDKAIVYFNKLIDINPDDPGFYNQRGASEFNMGNYKAALDDFLKSNTLGPNNGQCLYNLAVTYEHLKDYPNALKYVQLAQQAKFGVSADYIKNLQQEANSKK